MLDPIMRYRLEQIEQQERLRNAEQDWLVRRNRRSLFSQFAALLTPLMRRSKAQGDCVQDMTPAANPC